MMDGIQPVAPRGKKPQPAKVKVQQEQTAPTPLQPKRRVQNVPADPHKKKTGMLWVTVVAIMVVVVIVWWLLAMGPNGAFHAKSGTDSFFQKLKDNITQLFSGNGNANTNTVEQQRVEDLRHQVFPQFDNVNEAPPTNISTNQ